MKILEYIKIFIRAPYDLLSNMISKRPENVSSHTQEQKIDERTMERLTKQKNHITTLETEVIVQKQNQDNMLTRITNNAAELQQLKDDKSSLEKELLTSNTRNNHLKAKLVRLAENHATELLQKDSNYIELEKQLNQKENVLTVLTKSLEEAKIKSNLEMLSLPRKLSDFPVKQENLSKPNIESNPTETNALRLKFKELYLIETTFNEQFREQHKQLFTLGHKITNATKDLTEIQQAKAHVETEYRINTQQIAVLLKKETMAPTHLGEIVNIKAEVAQIELAQAKLNIQQRILHDKLEAHTSTLDQNFKSFGELLSKMQKDLAEDVANKVQVIGEMSNHFKPNDLSSQNIPINKTDYNIPRSFSENALHSKVENMLPKVPSHTSIMIERSKFIPQLTIRTPFKNTTTASTIESINGNNQEKSPNTEIID